MKKKRNLSSQATSSRKRVTMYASFKYTTEAYSPLLSENGTKNYYVSIENDSRIRILSRERALISRMLIIWYIQAEKRTQREWLGRWERMHIRIARDDVRAYECAYVRSIDTAGGTTTGTRSLCI